MINQQAWNEWITYRKESKYPRYKTDRQKNFLSQFDYETQQQMVDYSVRNEYRGLFEVKREAHKGSFDKRQSAIDDWAADNGVDPATT